MPPVEPSVPEPHRLPASGLRWLYVDFNSYFASVEQQLQPHLRGRPVAVVQVETDSTSAIAASYEAKAFGIRTGTFIHEARKRCPEIVCVLARHDHYVDFHHRILDEIDRHIPVTAVRSIDEMACRLLDNEATEAAATGIARAIKRGLAANVGECLRCSIGIAPSRYLAKVATELEKPDGLIVLGRDDIPRRLLALSLRDLPGVGPNMERRLARAGVVDVRTLLTLPPARLRAIWGSVWGERMWYLLRGADLLEKEPPKRSVGHSHVMAPKLRTPDMARLVARRLTVKAADRLRRMEHYASALSFSTRLEDGSRLKGSERCWRAQDNDTFLDLLERIWDRTVRRRPDARPKKVSVTLHDLTAPERVQLELFDARAHDDAKRRDRAERLSRAVDAVNHRFGRDMVSVGMLPSMGRRFSGSKVAFNRIPALEEFNEGRR